METNTMRHNRILDLLKDNDHQRLTVKEQVVIRNSQGSQCGVGGIADGAYGERESIRQEDMENVAKLISLLRALYEKKYPTNCKLGLFPAKAGEDPPLCSGDEVGWCVYISEKATNNEQRCSCWPGFYGKSCEFTLCPGLGTGLYQWDQDGVCSGAGHCNKLSGKCETCTAGYFHGAKESCDRRKCAGSGANEDIEDNLCSGHGTCNQVDGMCTCEDDYSGAGCFFKKCPASNTVLYPKESPNKCDGHGACNTVEGTCQCETPYSGEFCEKKACPANCMDRGRCDESTGTCFCEDPHFGPRCEFTRCPVDCTSDSNGWCDSHTGTCLCKYGAGGVACKDAQYCAAETTHTEEANWYRLWDTPGWALCPAGEALHGLYRSDCQALSCINSAKCSGLCERGLEAGEEQIEFRHCYHSLSWYESFDTKGWSECEPNYFISGVYRSCDSLYCLQMAKCCSFKDSRWASCEELSWGLEFAQAGWVEAPQNKWLTGFYRDEGQLLSNLEKAKACTFSRGF